MKFNFEKIKSVDEISPVPKGRYPVEIEQVRENKSVKGHDVFELLLRVTDGEHAGAKIYDWLYFSEKALPRVKLLLKALGIETEGEVEITAELLKGRKCKVDVIMDTYTKDGEDEVQSSVVTFAGYHPDSEKEGGSPPF